MIFHKFDVTFFGLCNQFLSVIPQLISASKSTSVKHCYEFMPWHPTSTDPEKIALLYEAIKSLFSSLFQNQTGLVQQQQKVIIKQISRVQHTVSFVFPSSKYLSSDMTKTQSWEKSRLHNGKTTGACEIT